jgi:hypothetical protein
MFALWPGDRLNFSIFIKPTFGFAGQPATSEAGHIANTNVAGNFVIKMRLLTTLLTLLVLTNCKSTPDRQTRPTSWSIVGSWYTDLRDGGGAFDSIMNYGEMYVNDTSLYYQEERMGQGYDQKYYIKNDTIFKCFGTDKECEFIPMYRIDDLRNDTLWLTVNKDYTKRDPKTFWVRLPKNELGHYDHNWTKQNADSLGWAVVYDYDRRKFKYYATIGRNLDAYDSAVKVGTWKWDMNEQHIQEQLERRRKRGE